MAPLSRYCCSARSGLAEIPAPGIIDGCIGCGVFNMLDSNPWPINDELVGAAVWAWGNRYGKGMEPKTADNPNYMC